MVSPQSNVKHSVWTMQKDHELIAAYNFYQSSGKFSWKKVGEALGIDGDKCRTRYERCLNPMLVHVCTVNPMLLHVCTLIKFYNYY